MKPRKQTRHQAFMENVRTYLYMTIGAYEEVPETYEVGFASKYAYFLKRSDDLISMIDRHVSMLKKELKEKRS